MQARLDSDGRLMARARAARARGRLDEAARLLEEEGQRAPEAPKTAKLLAETLADLAASARLVRGYLRRMGLAESDYRGFDALDDPEAPRKAEDRLREAARAAPAGDGSDETLRLAGVDLLLAEGRADEAARIAFAGESPSATYLLGKAAFARGEWREATDLLLRAVAIAPGFGPAHRLAGRAFSELGFSQLAICHLELGLVIPEQDWRNVHAAEDDPIVVNPDYRGHTIYYARGWFYAIPVSEPAAGIRTDAGVPIARTMRKPAQWAEVILHRLLPPGLYLRLKAFAARSPLRRHLFAERPVGRFWRAHHLSEILDRIETE